MENSLNRLKAELRVPYLSDSEAEALINAIFALGYKHGVYDQKKVNMRNKHKYKLLLDWVEDELTSFSVFTKRTEYRDIIDMMTRIIGQYKTENNLFSAYKPKSTMVTVIHNGEEKQWLLDSKKEAGNLLQPIVERFIEEEDKKEAAKREREANKLNQNKTDE